MRTLPILAALALALATPAYADPGADATAALTAALDKFNGGDVPAFFAAHEDNASITDEFAPFYWSGPGTIQRWGEDYMKDAAKRGISDGHMAYGKPLHVESTADAAYIVLPTTYSFKQAGQKMAGVGSMTFVMHNGASGWKIANWTYSGAKPVAQ